MLRFTNALYNVRADGTYDDILKKYGIKILQ